MLKKIGLLFALIYLLASCASCIFTYCHESTDHVNLEFIHNSSDCEHEQDHHEIDSDDCKDSQMQLTQVLLKANSVKRLPSLQENITQLPVGFLQVLKLHYSQESNFDWLNTSMYLNGSRRFSKPCLYSKLFTSNEIVQLNI